jgi:hypothetical protein
MSNMPMTTNGLMCGLLIVAAVAAMGGVRARDQHEPLAELVAALDDETTAWVATARIRTADKAIVRLLLAPGRNTPGPHGDFNARMLALAKRGEPVIPAIAARLTQLSSDPSQAASIEAYALVDVIAAIGPAAVATLVDVVDGSVNVVIRWRALDRIASLEPSQPVVGQYLDTWARWRPNDDRLDTLRRAIAPHLPRLLAIMARAGAVHRRRAGAAKRRAGGVPGTCTPRGIGGPDGRPPTGLV